MAKTRLLVIVGCHGDDKAKVPPCPFRVDARTVGAGCATDYFCTAVPAATPTDIRSSKGLRLIDGYVEWPSEMRKPGDFPRFCPLAENDRGYKPRGKKAS